jgi:hypothetical protein
MAAVEPQIVGRGWALLLEHCAALDLEHCRPTARERLERLVGGTFAQLLIGALRRHPRRSEGA